MEKNKSTICPVEKAGLLDSKIRKLLQNPKKILSPYLSDGMKVLDVGCGPGYFSIEIAELIGAHGKVIAADLQEGMLEIIRNKISGTELANRIVLHKCGETSIGLNEKVDFALAFYMVHEVKETGNFFIEIKNLLNDNGLFCIIEPKVHVSKNSFSLCIEKVKSTGFELIAEPKVRFSRSAVMRKL